MDQNGKIGYAVLGLGVGGAHLDAAEQNQYCHVEAVCDLRQDRLDHAKEKYPDLTTYTDVDEMLRDPAIDIVSVCLPSAMHADYAIRCMEAGKHVLCEKPVDITPEAAQRIIEAKNRLGRKCGVIHQNRFNVDMKPIKEAIDSGRMGKLFLGTFEVKWYRTQNYYEENGGWRGTWGMDGGGSLMNQSVHTVDLMQWLMGKPVSVTSKWGIFDHTIETEDTTASLLTFENGAMATFVTSTCTYPGLCTAIKLYGTGGSVEADGDRLTHWIFKDAEEGEEEKMLRKYGHGNGGSFAKNAGLVTGHAYQVNDIIDAVRLDRDPVIQPEDAITAVKIINAVYESARTGRTVDIRY